MEYFLLFIGFCLMLVGIAGSLLPALPGPPLSWLCLLLIYFCPTIETNYWLLCITLMIAIIISIVDKVIAAQGNKNVGGGSFGI